MTEAKTVEKIELTIEQARLLAWLGESEFSQFGECKGEALDRLVELGFAQVHAPGEHQGGFIAQGRGDMYRAVSLTEQGRKMRKVFARDAVFEASCALIGNDDGSFAVQVVFDNIADQSLAVMIADSVKEFIEVTLADMIVKHANEPKPITTTVQ